MLSCSCDYDYDPQPGDWDYDWGVKELIFEPLNTSKRKRCCSCKKLINIGDQCIIHGRCRHPYDEIEARINGVDWECFEEPVIMVAPHYHCERCGELYLNFIELGYECLSPNESMEDALKEYWEITGFKPADEARS